MPLLFFVICFFLLGWAGYATKNWFRGKSEIRDLRVSVERLQRKFSYVRKQRDLLSQRSFQFERALHQKNKKVQVLRWHKRNLERELVYAAQKINALKSKVTELSAVPAGLFLKPSIQGMIVRVNPAYEYAMINLGKEQNVHEGRDLFVIREGVIQGALRVDKSFETFSLCSMQPTSPAHFFQSGDLVVE